MTNYVETTIGGKKRGFEFGLHCLGELLEFLDTDMQGLGNMLNKNPFRAVPVILYFGHSSYLKIEGKPVDFELSDVSQWVSDLPKGLIDPTIDTILNVYLDSLYKHVPGLKDAQKEIQKNAKKKLTGQKT